MRATLFSSEQSKTIQECVQNAFLQQSKMILLLQQNSIQDKHIYKL